MWVAQEECGIAVGRVGLVGACHYVAVDERHYQMAELAEHFDVVVHLVQRVPPLVLLHQPARWTPVWQWARGCQVGSSDWPSFELVGRTD